MNEAAASNAEIDGWSANVDDSKPVSALKVEEIQRAEAYKNSAVYRGDIERQKSFVKDAFGIEPSNAVNISPKIPDGWGMRANYDVVAPDGTVVTGLSRGYKGFMDIRVFHNYLYEKGVYIHEFTHGLDYFAGKNMDYDKVKWKSEVQAYRNSMNYYKQNGMMRQYYNDFKGYLFYTIPAKSIGVDMDYNDVITKIRNIK